MGVNWERARQICQQLENLFRDPHPGLYSWWASVAGRKWELDDVLEDGGSPPDEGPCPATPKAPRPSTTSSVNMRFARVDLPRTAYLDPNEEDQ